VTWRHPGGRLQRRTSALSHLSPQHARTHRALPLGNAGTDVAVCPTRADQALLLRPCRKRKCKELCAPIARVAATAMRPLVALASCRASRG
jgi:hypothetical protein